MAADPLSRERNRAQYRELHKDVQQNKETYSSAGQGARLQQVLTQLDQLRQHVTKPREEACDAEVFADLAGCASEATRKLACGVQGRSGLEFLTALRHNYVHTSNPQADGQFDAEAFDWSALGQTAGRLFVDAPRFTCMLGPMDVQEKVRKAPKPREAKKPMGELVRSEEVVVEVDVNRKETEYLVELMLGKMRALPPVPMAELVCNVQSLAQTTENLFVLSNLVKEGRVRLYHEEERGLMVSQLVPGAGDRGGQAQRQFIISLEMSDWEVMRTIVKPEDCVMPHRDPKEREEREREEAGPRKKSRTS